MLAATAASTRCSPHGDGSTSGNAASLAAPSATASQGAAPELAPPAPSAPVAGGKTLTLERLADGIWDAFVVEGAVLVVRDDGQARTISRLAGGGLVDEPALLEGLPGPSTISDGEHRHPQGIMALGGRWPRPLVLLHAPGVEYTWDGARWRERRRRDGELVFWSRSRWQSGRGLLFDACNLLEGCREWPAYAYERIPGALPLPPERGAMAFAPNVPAADTWIGRGGQRASVLYREGGNELLLGGKRVATGGVEPGIPVYLRRDGQVVAGVREGNEDLRFPRPGSRTLSCGPSQCVKSDPAEGPISFVREIGGALYGFGGGPGAPRAYRLDGARWVTLAGLGDDVSAVDPVGDGDDTSLLLITEGASGKSLSRWKP